MLITLMLDIETMDYYCVEVLFLVIMHNCLLDERKVTVLLLFNAIQWE